MDDRGGFEARAVIAPSRRRLSRITLLIPVIALVAIAGIGLSGNRAHDATADLPNSTSRLETSGPPPTAVVQYPAQILGIDVHRLGDVQLASLTRDDVVAVAGWYVPLAITACPEVVASDAGIAPPQIQPSFDPWAYCERSGVLYAAPPASGGHPTAPDASTDAGIGPSAVDARLVTGVRLPSQLERVGAAPLPVVVLGHFVETSSGCMLLGMCPSELIVDYLGWAPAL